MTFRPFNPQDNIDVKPDTFPNWEYAYLHNLQRTMIEGNDRIDRTGTGTRSIFAPTLNIDLRGGFPLATTKKMGVKTIINELLWFLQMRDRANERDLCEMTHGTRDESKTTIWTDNANSPYWLPKSEFDGDLGRVYGIQWRTWGTPNGETVDQIANVIESLKNDPTSRRHIVTAWNPGELDQMALPPCHLMMLFHVDFANDGTKYLNLEMVMRSTDSFLGENFNIVSYATLVHMIAHLTGMQVGKLAMRYTDYHIYSNHFDQVIEQISRTPFDPPTLKLVNLENVKTIDDFTIDNFVVEGYKCHPAIKAKMAV